MEIQQRLPLTRPHILHLSNKNRMIPSLLRMPQMALQIRQSTAQNRRPMRSPVKSRPGRLSMLMRFSRSRIKFRNQPLIRSEHVNPKPFLLQ